MFYNNIGGEKMRKNRQRRELSRIFERYFRLGLHKSRADVFCVCRRIEGACGSLSAAKDVFAVWELCRMLKLENRVEELETFEKIYLNNIKRCDNDISNRVITYAEHNFCDPRTVYRRLAYIEKTYYKIRNSI